MSGRAFYLISYDVPDDRRRLKVARSLEAVGERVQYSVFEAWLSERELTRLRRRLERILQPEEDSVRIYFLCAACREKRVLLGVGDSPSPPQVVVL